MKFNLDNPVIRALTLMANLLWLNTLALVCCLPVFTAGAALTATHYMCRKIVLDEDAGILKGFFHSFRQNFRQATIIWLLFLLIFALLGGDIYLMSQELVTVPRFAQILIYIIGILILLTYTAVFPILSRFEGTISTTVRNAFIIAVTRLPKTVLALALTAAPWVMLLLAPQYPIIPLFFGISLPAYLYALMFRKFYAQLEGIESTPEEENEETDNT